MVDESLSQWFLTVDRRELNRRLRASMRSRILSEAQMRARILGLERDLASVALVARALADLCVRKRVITRAQLEEQLAETDLEDGASDDALDPKLVKPGTSRRAAPKTKAKHQPASKPERRGTRRVRRRGR